MVASFDPAAHLRHGASRVGWQDGDLWLAALAMGANLYLADVTAITSGGRPPTAQEYGLLAAALDDRLRDLGAGQLDEWTQP